MAASPAVSAVALAGLPPERCAAAEKELSQDGWALAAMGDQAMCLIDAGKLDAARNRLDQLAAITPQDWRIPLARAVLADKAGDHSGAQALYAAAAEAAHDGSIRSAITNRAAAQPAVAGDKPLQLPLPGDSH